MTRAPPIIRAPSRVEVKAFAAARRSGAGAR